MMMMQVKTWILKSRHCRKLISSSFHPSQASHRQLVTSLFQGTQMTRGNNWRPRQSQASKILAQRPEGSVTLRGVELREKQTPVMELVH